jgi:hypothetical protein
MYSVCVIPVTAVGTDPIFRLTVKHPHVNCMGECTLGAIVVPHKLIKYWQYVTIVIKYENQFGFENVPFII